MNDDALDIQETDADLTRDDEAGGLYEHFRIVVDKGQEPERIDKFLMNHIENISRNRIQNAASAGCVLVNGKPVKSNYRIRPLDTITIVLNYPPREVEIVAQDIPLDIVYEDTDLVVVNKQSGLVVHPGHGNFDGTLLNALRFHFEKSGAQVENGFGYLVHRIDKDTTGLILIAKSEEAKIKLAKQFFDHTIHRRYQALVWGDFAEDEGTIEGNIGRSANDRRTMTVYPDSDTGKPAITHFRVIERFGYVTFVECRLETGRTHQIRVHMKHIGHPLFNDATYGGNVILKGTTFSKYKQFIENCFKMIPRQALHAKELGFVHPSTGKEMMFTSELPDDMSQVLEKWRGYLKSRNKAEEE